MIKKQFQIVEEKGFGQALKKALERDKELNSIHMNVEVSSDTLIEENLLNIYLLAEETSRQELDEFCQWIMEHYNAEEIVRA